MRVLQRGRAIVRRVPVRPMGRTYRPGDFVLTRSEGGLARLLGLATGGMLNHAALIVDASGGLIEATAEVTLGAGTVRRAHIADYLKAGAPCWVGYVELQEGTRQAVVDAAERLLAAEWPLGGVGLTALVLQALFCIAPQARTARHAWLRPLRPLFERQSLVLREEHTYLSGELVARALERGGFAWERDPAHITPADLFRRFHPGDDERGLVVSLAQLRQARQARRTDQMLEPTSLLAPRVAHAAGGGSGEAALHATVPWTAATPEPDGVRVLAQVALWALGGLTLVYGIEALLRALQSE